MRAKPYLLTAVFLISCGIFCISCFKVAGLGYLGPWEFVMGLSALVWGYLTRALYDYLKEEKQ